LETVRIYRDCISRAVHDDIRLFIKNFLGDVPTQQAIKFLTQADDELERFMVLFRYRKLRSLSENAITDMNELPARLATLNIFPVECRELPQSPPQSTIPQMLYYLCQANYDAVVHLINDRPSDPDFAALSIIASLLKNNTPQALKTVETHIPKPSTHVLDNTAAAMAYLSSIGKVKGLSAPMYHSKKAIDYLKRMEFCRETNPLIVVFSQYVTGAVYTMLPRIVESRQKGIEMLEELNDQINTRKIKTGRLSKWLMRTLDFEIFPVLQIRIHRFLADAYINRDQSDEAIDCLERIIKTADPESEDAHWARMKRLRI
jgi:tetratricopeptide (TPR) repeat protein